MKYFLGALLAFTSVAVAQVQEYGQCGGIGWTGGTTCVSGSTCQALNSYYSQCLPGSGGSGGSPTTTTTSGAPTSTGKVKFAGVNIAGFDFGCGTDGTCNTTQSLPPPNGVAQMQHFVNDDKFNLFRLPVGWQYLLNNTLGGTLNSANFAKYDQLVQGCLATGAYCIIDIHNYARWNGGIIGQGGPTNAQFANVWSQLATKYASQSRIIFGTMNEPHDVPDINAWATSVQAVVTAIRQAGATSQMILLPGNDWTSAAAYISDGSAAALSKVTNLDGSTTNLILEVHKYSDSDNSGTHDSCVTNNIDDAFAPLATYARQNKRLVLNTEFGGGDNSNCVSYINQQLDYLNQNSDVFLGWTGWSAGAFATNYTLSLVPVLNGNTWTDTQLVSQALVPAFSS